MKYVRTKDGYIYEIETIESGGMRKGYFKNANNTFNLYFTLKEWQLDCKNPYFLDTPKGYTVCEKQADTIEELCDEFVYSDEVFKNVIYNNFHALKILLKLRKNYVVYGAVWCDKGLIYVAKMKDIFPNGEIDWVLL